MVYVGIDLHKRDLVMAFDDGRGPVDRPRRFGCRDTEAIVAAASTGAPLSALVTLTFTGNCGTARVRWFLEIYNDQGQLAAESHESATSQSQQAGQMRGDVDGDGQITVGDAIQILLISSGDLPHQAIADANGDGTIDAADARMVIAYASGIYPPVQCQPDQFDPNSWSNRRDVGAGTYRGLRLLGGLDGDDYYSVTVPARTRVSVDITFTHARGDLNLSLGRAADGGGLVPYDESYTSADSEHVTWLNDSEQSEGCYILVSMILPECQTYDMVIGLQQYGTCDDDRFEDNDTEATAAHPSAGAWQGLTIGRTSDTEYDRDWYAVSVEIGKKITVDVTPDDPECALVLKGFPGGTSGTGASSADDGQQSLSWCRHSNDPGIFYFRVTTTTEGCFFYSMRITTGQDCGVLLLEADFVDPPTECFPGERLTFHYTVQAPGELVTVQLRIKLSDGTVVWGPEHTYPGEDFVVRHYEDEIDTRQFGYEGFEVGVWVQYASPASSKFSACEHTVSGPSCMPTLQMVDAPELYMPGEPLTLHYTAKSPVPSDAVRYQYELPAGSPIDGPMHAYSSGDCSVRNYQDQHDTTGLETQSDYVRWINVRAAMRIFGIEYYSPWRVIPLAPCMIADDAENNDAPAQAPRIYVAGTVGDTKTVPDMTVQHDDADWYFLHLHDRRQVDITVSFINGDGDIDVYLYEGPPGADMADLVEIGAGVSGSDGEQVRASYCAEAGDPDEILVYLLVVLSDGKCASYDMRFATGAQDCG